MENNSNVKQIALCYLLAINMLVWLNFADRIGWMEPVRKFLALEF